MAKLKSKQVQLVVGDFVLGTSSIDPNYDSGFFTGLHSGSRISDAFATISLQMVPFSSSISSRVSIINTLLYNVSESNSTRLSSLEALTSSLWTASDGIIRKVGNVQISGSVSILNSLEFSAGAIISKFSTDGTLGDNSDSAVPTEKAVKNYVDSQVFLVSSGSVTGDGSQLYLAKWVSSSSITSSGIYETSAKNVGIGTILPQGKLHVDGVITASNLKIASNISASDIYINNQSFVLGYSSSVENRITTLESSTGGLWTASIGYISRQSNVKITGSLAVSHSINTNFINLKQLAAPTYQQGRVFYDTTDSTLAFYNDVSGLTVRAGREQLVKVRNNTGATIPAGRAVYINGSTGNRPTIALADAKIRLRSVILGLTAHSIANNSDGYVTLQGVIRNLNTSAYTVGSILYLSGSTGQYSTNRQYAPYYSNRIGHVVNSHLTQGMILVRPIIGDELSRLQDVARTVTGSDGNLLVYSTNSTAWSGSISRKMILTTQNRLGVGTINPMTTLHVSGTVSASRYDTYNDYYVKNIGLSGSIAKLYITASDHETRITTLESSPSGLWTSSNSYINRESDVKITGSLYVSSNILIDGTVDGVNVSSFSSSVLNDINSLQADSSSFSDRTALLESTASDHETRITTLETVPAGLWTSSDGYINRESDVKITGSLYLSGSSTKDILYKSNNGQLILIPQPTSSVAYLMWSASNYFWVDSIDGGSF